STVTIVLLLSRWYPMCRMICAHDDTIFARVVDSTRIPLLVFYDYVRANCSAKMSVMENVTVSRQEQQRGLVIAEVDRGALSVGEGAAVLDVSARHVRRILTAYRQRGVAALAHGNRGKVPTNAVDEETRQAVVTLASTRYVGFNQVHLTEQLGEVEGLALSRSSVRRILGAAGIGSPRKRRAPQHRSRRPRYPKAGMLVHAAQRAPRCQPARLVRGARPTSHPFRGD
ncbi:MAG TPA: hypothetical protein DEV93_09840, partial [Chloroflexi bacterium]|nr:hypothetical protein [Chloroflexota bacterium]